MDFPLAELELSRTGKRVSTYAVRGVAVGIAWLVMGVVWFFSVLLSGSGGVSGAELGEFFSSFLAYASRIFQFLAVFAVAPLFSAGLVAREKQERTLGLLLMADLRGRDIFLAKYLSAFLYVELLVLSALPILAFASIFGGISVPEMALQVFLLTIAAAAMCAVGLFFSTVTSRPVEALFATILFECAWIMGTSFFDFFCRIFLQFSKFSFLTTSILTTAWSVDRFSVSPGYWLLSAGITAVIGIVAALLTILLLPGQARDKPARRPILARPAARRLSVPLPSPRHSSVVRAPGEEMEVFLARQAREDVATVRPRRRRKSRLSRELIPRGAVARLAAASAPGLTVFRQPWPIQLLVAIALIPLGFLSCLGRLFIFLIVCYDITSSIAGARQDGSFDGLLVTPADDRSLTRGLFSIYAGRSLLFLPTLAVTGLWGLRYFFFLDPDLANLSLATTYLVLTLIVSPVVTLLFYVTLGCWASTFNLGPAGQSFAAAGIYLGIRIALGIFNAIVSSFAMIFGGIDPTFGPMMEQEWSTLYFLLQTVAPVSTTTLVFTAASLGFYYLFAHHLATRWRTGRLLFSGPASR